MCGVARISRELTGDLGELQRLIPQLACLRRLHVDGNEVVSAPVGSAVAGVVEEPDGARACRLETPRIGVEGTRQRAESGVSFDRNVEADPLEGLLEQRDIVVRIAKPADL